MEKLIDEAKRLESLCLLAAERHYAAGTWWFRMNWALGIPSSVLMAFAAGIAAFGAFAAASNVTALMAAAAAVLAALLTVLDPRSGGGSHHATAKRYEGVYHAAGFFWRFEVAKNGANAKDLEQQLLALRRKFEELTESSPAIPARAYRVASGKLVSATGEVLRIAGEMNDDVADPPLLLHRADDVKVIRRA